MPLVVALLVLLLPATAVAETGSDAMAPTKQQRALNRYQQFWQSRADALYGAEGMPAPLSQLGSSVEGAPASVNANEQGIRQVGLGPSLLADLGSKKRATKIRRTMKTFAPGSKARRNVRRTAKLVESERAKDRKYAKQALLHEWAHVYQSPEILNSLEDREGGADVFADQHGRALLGTEDPKTFYGNDRAAFLAKYGPDYWRQGQFGANWGADPTTITYPGAVPPTPIVYPGVEMEPPSETVATDSDTGTESLRPRKVRRASPRKARRIRR